MEMLMCLLLLLQANPPKKLAKPVVSGKWIVPAQGVDAEPVWGIKGGISVGLWPTGGPRGLLRIYTPYLKHPRLRMINYIAVEPKVGDGRGLSELEHSDLDNKAGKRMWTTNDFVQDPKPALPWRPARGKIVRIDGKKALTFYVCVEAFKNGAQPIIQVILREDRPYEVGLKVYAAKGSKEMKACILSATMGNYARLRHLWLKDRIVLSTKLWTEYKPTASGFAPSREWKLDRLLMKKGDVIVAATPDEADPAGAKYGRKVPSWWRYKGRVAVQYWRKPDPHKDLVVRVNGRKTFWGDSGTIPGGVSYENFEMEEPFSAGQEFWFGVTPASPTRLGFPASCRKRITDGR